MKLFKYLFFSLFISHCTYAGGKTTKPVRIIEDNLEAVRNYLLLNREAWFQKNLEWFTAIPTPHDPGEWKWISLYQKQVGNATFDVFKKPTDEKSIEAFFYWNGNEIELPFEIAIDFFISRIELSAAWTPVFANGMKILETPEGDQVWYQHYEPGYPLSPRNLITAYTVRKLEENEIPEEFSGHQVTLISMNSIPNEIIPVTLPSEKKEPRIHQRGAYLLVSTERNSVRVYKVDAENQGGMVPENVTNLAFPYFVQQEAEGQLKYIQEHRDEIINSYYKR